MSHPTVRVVSAEIERDGRYLLTQRLAKAVLPHLWEFPGGRVHAGQDDVEALTAALRRRVGAQITVGEQVLEVTHNYDDYTVVMSVYCCELGPLEPRAVDVQDIAWVSPSEFAAYPFPPADEATVKALVDALDG